MLNNTSCPVPKNQRPFEEYKEFSLSWFFSWPKKGEFFLISAIFTSWILVFPLIVIITSKSLILKGHLMQILIISFTTSLFFPIILLIRQLMGWQYVLNRLISEKIEYEETGWYDGQIWEKPTEWRERDILIAAYEVKPIIRLIKTSMMLLGIIFISCIIPNLLNISVIKT